jgi:hypothetical protein
MSSVPSWLPQAFALANFPDLNSLEAAAFTHFRTAWANHPTFRGDEVRVHRNPHLANPNRWNTYWHCVTEGEPETTRTVPILDRLERIPWTRPVIENETDASSGIKVWANVRGRDQHVCVWFEPENYLIVLKIAHNHFVLKTTYRPQANRRAQLHRDYTAYKKTGREF